MSKFIVIKFKNIIFIILSILIIIALFSFIYLYQSRNTSALSSMSNSHSPIEFDLNGDSIKDKLNIMENNGCLQIKAETFNNEYILKSSENNSNLFNICSWYSLKPQYIDLNRDNINELIVSGIYDNNIKNYIFKWSNDSFINVYTSNKNVLGILNSNNSRSPIILDSNISTNNGAFNSYILLSDLLKNTSNANITIPGLDSIAKFIDLIEYPYEILETPDIFSNYISSSQLSLLWKLNKSSNRYTFINCFFHDINWDNNGTPSSILWTLSFKKNSLLDSKAPNEEFILYLQTDLNELSEYKISSIQK